MVRYPMMTPGANVVNPGLPTKYCLLFAVLVAAAGLGSLFLSEKHKKEELMEEVIVLDNLLKKSMENTLIHRLKLAAKDAELEQKQLDLTKLNNEIEKMEAEHKYLELALENRIINKERNPYDVKSISKKETNVDNAQAEEMETKFRVLEPEKPTANENLARPSLFDFFDAVFSGEYRNSFSEDDYDNDVLEDDEFINEDSGDLYFDILGDQDGSILIMPLTEEESYLESVDREPLPLPEEENRPQEFLFESKAKEVENRENNDLGFLDNVVDTMEESNDIEGESNSYPFIIDILFQPAIESDIDRESESTYPSADEQSSDVIEVHINPLLIEIDFDTDEVSKPNELENTDNANLESQSNVMGKQKESDKSLELESNSDANKVNKDHKKVKDINRENGKQQKSDKDVKTESKDGQGHHQQEVVDVDSKSKTYLQQEEKLNIPSDSESNEEPRNDQINLIDAVKDVLDFELVKDDKNKMTSEGKEKAGVKTKDKPAKSGEEGKLKTKSERSAGKPDSKVQVETNADGNRGETSGEIKLEARAERNTVESDNEVQIKRNAEDSTGESSNEVSEKAIAQRTIEESNDEVQIELKAKSSAGESNDKVQRESKAERSTRESNNEVQIESKAERSTGESNDEVQIESKAERSTGESNDAVEIESKAERSTGEAKESDNKAQTNLKSNRNKRKSDKTIQVESKAERNTKESAKEVQTNLKSDRNKRKSDNKEQLKTKAKRDTGDADSELQAESHVERESQNAVQTEAKVERNTGESNKEVQAKVKSDKKIQLESKAKRSLRESKGKLKIETSLDRNPRESENGFNLKSKDKRNEAESESGPQNKPKAKRNKKQEK